MNKTPNWEQLRSFHAVIQTKSLSAAARQLGCTQPTVGRHIGELEAGLARPLFVRSRHGLTPTDVALELVQYTDTMTKASAALLRAATGGGAQDGKTGGAAITGTVRLTTSDIVGALVLPHLLPGFRERYPGIALELAMSNTTQDLSKREADIAIRMVRPVQNALIARKIASVPVRLYAHRDYLAAHGTPASPADLKHHTLIGYDTDLTFLETMAERGIRLARTDFQVRSDDELAQHALLEAGIGIGGMQEHLARRSPNLVAVLPDELPVPMDMWLVMHEDLKTSPPVRKLYDYLAPSLKAFVAGR